MDDLIQIFVPTFNRSKLVVQAIDSIQRQGYKNLQIIVLDNASSDDTPTMIESLVKEDRRIVYIRHESNLGLVGNFNSISKYISAPYFTVITDDDVYLPHFLDSAMQLFSQYPESAATIFNAPTRKNGKIISSQLSDWKEGFYTPRSALRYALEQKHPILTNCLYRRDVANIFNFETEVGGAGDVYFFVRLLSIFPVSVSKKITGYYDLHSANASVLNVGLDSIRQNIILKRKIDTYLGSINADPETKYTYIGIFSAIRHLLRFSSGPVDFMKAAHDREFTGYYGNWSKYLILLIGLPIIFWPMRSAFELVKLTKNSFAYLNK